MAILTIQVEDNSHGRVTEYESADDMFEKLGI